MELNKKLFEQELISLLEKTTDVHQELIGEFKKLIANQPNDFWGKKSEVAHMTASALVVDESRTEVLLTNHKKLKKWLQLGGHWCDFENYPSTTVLEAALKEVKEEGYGNEEIPYKVINESNPLDLDIHSVGSHMHYDICFFSRSF